jgi:hypothetical protein
MAKGHSYFSISCAVLDGKALKTGRVVQIVGLGSTGGCAGAVMSMKSICCPSCISFLVLVAIFVMLWYVLGFAVFGGAGDREEVRQRMVARSKFQVE